MYDYRTLSSKQQADVRRKRAEADVPLHRPPHLKDSSGCFLITAATYEHQPHFSSEQNLMLLSRDLLSTLSDAQIRIYAWIVLPNHYHLLVQCHPLSAVSRPLGCVHGRTSRLLNQRDGAQGRKVWNRYSDRLIRDERHFFTTLNYIHYNPFRHGYIDDPLGWTCSSIHRYRDRYGIGWLRDVWRDYPLRDYGKNWDW